jgi:hypothetical protein
MNRFIIRGIASLLLLAVFGCGGSKPEGLVKEVFGLQSDLAKIMEKGDLQGSEDKLEKIKARLEEIGQEINSPKFSNEQRKTFNGKYGEEVKAMEERLISAYSKLAVDDRKLLDNIFYGKDHKYIPKMW